jgi:pyrophosphatase PpaX
MPARWDALLFDLDGTLADSVGLILHCYRHTMRVHLGRQLPDDLWMAGLGTPLDRQLAAFARNDVERAEMVKTYRSYQLTVHDRMVSAFPGVADSLGRFRSDGVPLGVVTSKHREVTMRTLRVCGIEDRFDFIITPEDVQRAKPDPEPVLAACAPPRPSGARFRTIRCAGNDRIIWSVNSASCWSWTRPGVDLQRCGRNDDASNAISSSIAASM